VRFQFFATAGTFSPGEQESELNPALSGGMCHTDAEYNLPAADEVPAGGLRVMLWSSRTTSAPGPTGPSA
jgi:hypothetical protein